MFWKFIKRNEILITMKKIFISLSLTFLLNGCAESVALLGNTAGGVSSGKIMQSSLNTAASFGIKKQTGKSPVEHAMTFVKEKNPSKKKEPCISFVEKTNSEICNIVKKQISKTKVKIATSLQPLIDKRSRVNYLNK